MKFKLLLSQKGISLPIVLAVTTIGIFSLSYTITDLLPKLQKEKDKIGATINYRIFLSSLNDYLIHSIRERWCFKLKNGTETDLLISDQCGNGRPMENIVTYAGNLERILWTADNIGTTPTSMELAKKDNRILAINYARYHAIPALTTRLLKFGDIAPPDGQLSFTLTDNALDDMTDEHPLYVISRSVKGCLNSVDIKIFQVKDTNNIQTGDERKIGVKLTANINRLKPGCFSIREATSTSYYTFYPRRLHSYSLMKYGNLDGNLNNEFHGPVYLAGDFVLPQVDGEKATATTFYNTLTLGIFNGGSDSGGRYKAGRIVNRDLSNYTFSDRGHPYRSKQDSYPGFRGFRGGVRLDATEDKGFYNLFDASNETAADMDRLKQCIEEAKYQTIPSLNLKSRLAYSSYANDGTSASLKLSFTEKNRFKSGLAPVALKEVFTGKNTVSDTELGDTKGKDSSSSKVEETEIEFKVPPPANGMVSYGELFISPIGEAFKLSRDNHYAATIGSGSTAEVYFNYEGFDLTTARLQEFIDKVKNASRDNFEKVIDADHVLYASPERVQFQAKALALDGKCSDKSSAECSVLGHTKIECAKVPTGSVTDVCDYSEFVDDFKKAQKDLTDKLTEIKGYVESEDPDKAPKLVISLNDYTQNSKLVINQKELKFTSTPAWNYFYRYLKSRLGGLTFEFKAYHYSSKVLRILLKNPTETGSELQFVNQNYTTTPDKTLYTSWRNTSDNTLISPDPKSLVELNCPNGMGLADWDLDMSASSSFAWNYANTPSGVEIESPDHDPLPEITFSDQLLEGHRGSTSKSVVQECIIPANRTHIYGLYVCEKLTIKERTTPLYMIGTFIVKTLNQPKMKTPVYWYSIWDTKASDFILSDLNRNNPICMAGGSLLTVTFDDIMNSDLLKSKLNACSALDLVTNGPNNFNWTTVDPEIGIANPGDSMTSQKANRIQKWVVKEESRLEMIR